MGFFVDVLVFQPVFAVLQASAGIVSPVENPQAKRLQRCTAALALLGIVAICVGLTVGLAAAGLTAVASGYVLLVLAGLMGECIERRVWPTSIGDPD